MKKQDESPLAAIRALALINVMLKAGIPFHKALASSRMIAEGALRESLDGAFRNALLGRCPSIARAIEDEIGRFPPAIHWVARTIREFMLCSAEPDDPRKEELLDRSFTAALDSCRQSIRESISGLRVPVSAIFALGIVLPIVIATMIPLWGMAYTDTLRNDFYGHDVDVQSDPGHAGGMSDYMSAAPILMFPMLCLLITDHVLSDKEFISGRSMRSSMLRIVTIDAAIGAATLLILLLIGRMASIWAFIGIGILSMALASRFLAKESESMRLESIYSRPSVLNSISSRLNSGEHFVRAVALSSGNSKEGRRIFWSAMRGEAARPGEERPFGDEMVHLISEASRKDCGLAAQILRQVSRHLNELASIEAEARFELKPIAQSVLVATIFLSPFVLGIAAGFGSLGSLAHPGTDSSYIIEGLFVAFIAEMVVAGLWIIKRISPGERTFKGMTDRPLLAFGISMAIFLLSWSFSKAMFS